MESGLGARFAPDSILENIKLNIQMVISKHSASRSVVLHMTRASLLCDAQFWNNRQAAWRFCSSVNRGRKGYRGSSCELRAFAFRAQNIHCAGKTCDSGMLYTSSWTKMCLCVLFADVQLCLIV